MTYFPLIFKELIKRWVVVGLTHRNGLHVQIFDICEGFPNVWIVK